jgi:hypothetical protein
MSFKILKMSFFLFLAVCSISACGTSTSHRQTQRDQNEADSNAQMSDLGPAEADYDGTMTMVQSQQSLRVKLSIKRVYENVRPRQPQDPTQTINLPKLSGFLRFPVLDKMDPSDYGHYSEIINPMGGFSTVLFDYGDYDPKTKLMILPYNVSGYNQGSFGELQGELHGGVFTGTWFAKPLGVVGHFVLNQISSSAGKK